MTDMTLNSSLADGAPIQPAARPNLDKGFNPLTMILFFGVLAAGLLYVTYSIYADVDATGTKVTTYLPYFLLLVALLILMPEGVSAIAAARKNDLQKSINLALGSSLATIGLTIPA